MPPARKYADRAAQQAAYRKSQSLAHQDLAASKGLPRLPAIPTLPGHSRWLAMRRMAHSLLQTAAEEIQGYFEERSEVWQQSSQAEELWDQIQQLQETLELIEAIH